MDDAVPMLLAAFLQGAVGLTYVERSTQAATDYINQVTGEASKTALDGEVASRGPFEGELCGIQKGTAFAFLSVTAAVAHGVFVLKGGGL